jgi:hypothetical protein
LIPLPALIERFSKGWRMGRPFTECGSGSLRENTVNARKALLRWCAEYDLKVVNDAGAGDLYWLAGAKLGDEFRAFDLVPRHQSVKSLDISTQPMPPCDLIICRWVFNHLDGERIDRALGLFRQCGRYLAATQFDGDSPSAARIDLRPKLGGYLDAVPDAGVKGCTLALWKL